jgi:hypothetical protein
MHIHASQLNLNAELYAAQSAARTEARMAAELTRKKLRDFASALAGEADEDDYCVLALEARGEQQGHSNQQSRQDEPSENERHEQLDSLDDAFSGWA